MLGHATEKKLHLMGIYTIGELAKADPQMLHQRFGKAGVSLWHSANGRYNDVLRAQPEPNKGFGNSVTLPADVTTAPQAHKILLSLCETVGMRMRQDKQAARCLSVSLKTLPTATDSTEELFRCACRIFDEVWDGVTPLRQLGVQATRLEERGQRQYSLFDIAESADFEKKAKLDNLIDDLREKHGEGIIRRARFVGVETVLAGGLSKERRTGVTKPVGED